MHVQLNSLVQQHGGVRQFADHVTATKHWVMIQLVTKARENVTVKKTIINHLVRMNAYLATATPQEVSVHVATL